MEASTDVTTLKPEQYRAVVGELKSKGPHGPHTIAFIKDDPNHPDLEGRSVTFSLLSPVWEGQWPENGAIVILEGVFVKDKGFRARKARLAVPGE